MATRMQARRSRRRGAVVIEYALILPALLIFILGLMDTGRLLWSYTTLYRGTEAAARCAAINTNECGTTAQIQSYAAAQSWGLTIAPSAFTVAPQTCGIQVHGAYDFTFIVPGFSFAVPTGTVRLNATACYPQ